jgi:hypothetical protein
MGTHRVTHTQFKEDLYRSIMLLLAWIYQVTYRGDDDELAPP